MKKTKIEITDDLIDNIIDEVLLYVDCEHWEDREEDGIHTGAHYNVQQGCEKAVREVLEGKNDK